jgi:hypothetical protein
MDNGSSSEAQLAEEKGSTADILERKRWMYVIQH